MNLLAKWQLNQQTILDDVMNDAGHLTEWQTLLQELLLLGLIPPLYIRMGIYILLIH